MLNVDSSRTSSGKIPNELLVWWWCLIGVLSQDCEKTFFGKKSKFWEHLNLSRVEFLKAVRSLLDERIEHIEKKGKPRAGKMTKIDVE